MSSLVPEGWFSKSLDEVSIFIRDGTHGTHERLNEGIPLLSAKNISSDGHINCDSGDSLISEIDYQKIHAKYVIEKDDLLLTVVGTLGRTALVPKGFRKFTLQRSVAIIRLDAKTIHPELCYQYLSGDEFQRQLSLRSNSTAQAGVYLGELARISIPVPPLPEQKKIASILTSVDEVIENTQKQIDKLQDLKKATMNELLTKGIGHTEFKDSELGRIPEGWGNLPVAEVFEVGRGRVISKDEIRDNSGRYPVFSSQSKNNGEMGRLNSYDFEGEYVTWTTDGAYAGTVFYRSGRFNCTNVCGTLRDKGIHAVDMRFASEYLSTVAKNHVSYVGNPKLMNGVFGEIGLILPPLPEQKKIASILTSMDKNIEEKQRKLQQTQSLKKSLMQDLLTGKVRVTVN